MEKSVSLGLILAMTVSAADCTSNKKTDTAAPANTTGASGETAGENSGNPSGDPVTLSLVTGNTGTSQYSCGATFSEVIPRGLPADSMISTITEGGATSNPVQVAAGIYRMGAGYNLSNRWAYNGENLYAEAYDSLRGIAGYLDTFYYTALACTDAGWTDLAEMAANHTPIKISVLPVGNMDNIVTSMILEYYGMTFDDVIPRSDTVEYTNWSTSVESVKDGRTDSVCRNIARGHAAVTELSSTVNMTFIQFPQEMIDTLTDGRGFSPETLPASCFKERGAAIDTFGITSSLFCTADVPDGVIYDTTKALCENVDGVKAGRTALQRFTAEGAGDLAGMGPPLHPSVEKYYKEAGILD